MASTEEMVLLITATELLVAFGTFFAVVVVLLIVIGHLDAKVTKLRRDNKRLRRVLDDYFRLKDGSKRTARAIEQEAADASWFPPGWRL